MIEPRPYTVIKRALAGTRDGPPHDFDAEQRVEGSRLAC